MHGFLSRDGMPPAELLAAGRAEVAGVRRPPDRRHGHRHSRPERRTAASTSSLADGQRRCRARRLLVTTGLRDELPDIPGVRERWGRDLLHCPYCHGYEVRDQPLGVLGGTPGRGRSTRTWSASGPTTSSSSPTPARSTADEREQLVARAIGIVDGPVARLVVEDDRLTGVELTTAASSPRRRLRAPRLRPERRPAHRPRLRDPRQRLGRRRPHRPHQRARASGSPATPSTRAPRSSPPPAKAPPPPSPSTTTSSRRTCATPSRLPRGLPPDHRPTATLHRGAPAMSTPPSRRRPSTSSR